MSMPQSPESCPERQGLGIDLFRIWVSLTGHIVFNVQVCVNGASFNTSFPRCSRFFNTSTQQP